MAQTVFEGTIRDKNSKELLCDVICSVTDLSGTHFLGYAVSDKDGKYLIDFKTALDSVTLNVALLGYKSKALPLLNKSKKTDFQLEMAFIELKEVVVKSAPIWSKGDTLNYSVGAFKSEQDQVIGDVLKKLPGIEVNKQGGITYQGQAINRFYIEGLDLLQAKYSIATNNIPVDAIERIQVYENHQPIQALKDVRFSDQAAINLKLKDEKVMRPILKAEIGTGASSSSALWHAKFLGMQMGRDRQTLATFKTNNTGHELWSEVADHQLSLEDLYSGIPSYPQNLVNPVSLNKPPTEEKRYLKNESYIGTFNNLWRTGENSQFRLIATYLNDRNKQQMAERNMYYLGQADSNLITETVNQLHASLHQGEAILSFTNNTSSLYVDNTLKFFGQWQKTTSNINGTTQAFQQFQTPLFLVENKLELVKNKNKKNYQFHSFIRYSSQPQKLKVHADSLSLDNYGLLSQRSERNIFSTRNYTSFSRTFGHSIFQADIRFNANLEYLNSKISRNPFPVDRKVGTENRLKWNQYEYMVTPRYIYQGNKSRLEMEIPVSLFDLYANNRAELSGKEHTTRLLINPSASFRYSFNPYWEMRLSYRLTHEIGDMLDFADGLRMTDFQTFTYGSGMLEERKSQSYSLRLAYRNQIEAFFFNIMAIYRPQKSNLVNEREFWGNYSVLSGKEKDHSRKYLILNAYIGKYLEELKTNISLNSGYTKMNFRQFQQKMEWPVSSHLVNVNCKIDITPIEWTNILLNAELAGNKIASRLVNTRWLKQARAQLNWYFFPSGAWQLNIGGEYVCNELQDSPNLNLFFMDFGAKYKKKRWELSFDYTNVFNKRAYEYSSYNGVNSYSLYYSLRPAEMLITLGFEI